MPCDAPEIAAPLGPARTDRLLLRRFEATDLAALADVVPSFLPEILPAVEVGWRLDPAHWGRGLASEGARAALREGFTTLGLSEICSLPQAANPRSFTVCERIGMTYHRTVQCPATDRRGPVEARLYVMHRADWAACTADS